MHFNAYLYSIVYCNALQCIPVQSSVLQWFAMYTCTPDILFLLEDKQQQYRRPGEVNNILIIPLYEPK